MQITEDISTTVPSKLPDFREVPLANLPALSTIALDDAFSRGNRESTAVPVPPAFSSAI